MTIQKHWSRLDNVSLLFQQAAGAPELGDQ
jgi:hypothetical protein